MNPSKQVDLFPNPMAVSTHPVRLELKGSIPSFKNNKILITKGPKGRPLDRPLLITKPEYQKRMAEIVESFVCQLLSAFQTADGKTLTGCSLRSAIALSTPGDDAWTWVPEITIKGVLCAPGQEGASILIERL